MTEFQLPVVKKTEVNISPDTVQPLLTEIRGDSHFLKFQRQSWNCESPIFTKQLVQGSNQILCD